MIPTVQQVFDLVRQHLGDTEVAGGQLYTDDGAGTTVSLRLFLEPAYEKLFQRLSNIDAETVEATRYFDLPAHQSYVDPKSFGINDLGEVEIVRERRTETSLTILNAVVDASNPPQHVELTFAAPHGRSDGDEVVIYKATGISGDINDRWTITAPTTTTLRLLGATASGAYTANSGIMSYSAEGWSVELQSVDNDDVSAGQYRVIGERLRFHPEDHIRQFMLQITLSGRLPATDAESLSIDGSLNYLSYQTAGMAIAARNTRRSGELLRDAAIEMEGIVQGKVRALQKNKYQQKRWRNKRNTGDDLWYGYGSA